MRRRTIGIVAVALLASAGTAGAVGRDLKASRLPPPIPSSQNPLLGPAYVGSPQFAQPLPRKVRFRPSLSLMHADAGNTNTSNFPGPLGVNPVLQSAADLTLVPFMWDAADRLTTGCVAPGAQSSGRPLLCLAAVDPQTLEILARWLPPSGQDLNLAYLTETTDDQVLVTTREGHVFVVQRHDDRTGPSFSLVRDVDLVGRGVLKPSELLLAAMFDSRGNIWFTTGGILGIGDKPAPFTTLGYIDSNEGVHSIRIDDQIVENGFAVSGSTAFVVTGPAGAGDHPGAIGYMAAFDAGPSGTVQTLWREPYQAGDARKPGGFARGSGSTPTLLGHRYVAITDNANSQIHLLIYRQGNLDDGHLRLACRVPLFSPGASANDIGTIGEETHNADSVMALNDYNAPPIGTSLSPATINGSFNDMNQMAPGAERVDVAPGGTGCRVAWETPIRIKSVPFLSTATGLVYGYTQDRDLAAQGQYVWYFVALDYRTGKEVWRIRSGAGGTYNDSYEPGSLGPDGSFYQGLQLGVVRLRDGASSPTEPSPRPSTPLRRSGGSNEITRGGT